MEGHGERGRVTSTTEGRREGFCPFSKVNWFAAWFQEARIQYTTVTYFFSPRVTHQDKNVGKGTLWWYSTTVLLSLQLQPAHLREGRWLLLDWILILHLSHPGRDMWLYVTEICPLPGSTYFLEYVAQCEINLLTLELLSFVFCFVFD